MIHGQLIEVPTADAGRRLDRFLVERLPGTSRPLIRRAIEQERHPGQ